MTVRQLHLVYGESSQKIKVKSEIELAMREDGKGDELEVRKEI